MRAACISCSTQINLNDTINVTFQWHNKCIILDKPISWYLVKGTVQLTGLLPNQKTRKCVYEGADETQNGGRQPPRLVVLHSPCVSVNKNCWERALRRVTEDKISHSASLIKIWNLFHFRFQYSSFHQSWLFAPWTSAESSGELQSWSVITSRVSTCEWLFITFPTRNADQLFTCQVNQKIHFPTVQPDQRLRYCFNFKMIFCFVFCMCVCVSVRVCAVCESVIWYLFTYLISLTMLTICGTGNFVFVFLLSTCTLREII